MKLTEEDILSIGWMSFGQLEYINDEWELEHIYDDQWRINDESDHMMFFDINSLDELIFLMNAIRIKIPLSSLKEREEEAIEFGFSDYVVNSLKNLQTNWANYKWISNENTEGISTTDN